MLTNAHKLGSTETIQSQLFGGYILRFPAKRPVLIPRCDSQSFTLHTKLCEIVRRSITNVNFPVLV
jgi:hypothetical protein